MNELNGRVALVTGSTSGIGLVIANRLAQSGAHLVSHGLATDEQPVVLCDAFERSYGTSPHFADCDLRDYGQIEQMMADLNQRYGALDILVNNAGIQHVSPIADFPPKVWNDMMAINL